MASKLVTDRQKSSEVVLNAIEHQGGALQEGNTARSVAESGAAVDVGGLLAQPSLSLRGMTDTMIAADQAHEHELADDPAARTARDEAAKGVYDAIVGARETFVGVYGAAAVDALGFFGSTSQDPLVLVRQGRSIVDRLRGRPAHPQERPPEPRRRVLGHQRRVPGAHPGGRLGRREPRGPGGPVHPLRQAAGHVRVRPGVPRSGDDLEMNLPLLMQVPIKRYALHLVIPPH